MKTTGSISGDITDVRPGGLVKSQNITGLKMDNVNWSAAKIHNTDLGGTILTDCNLSGIVIADDCVIEGAMVGKVPLAKAVEMYRQSQLTLNDLDDDEWPVELCEG